MRNGRDSIDFKQETGKLCLFSSSFISCVPGEVRVVKSLLFEVVTGYRLSLAGRKKAVVSIVL